MSSYMLPFPNILQGQENYLRELLKHHQFQPNTET